MYMELESKVYYPFTHQKHKLTTLDPSQSGFQPSHGTKTTLVALVDEEGHQQEEYDLGPPRHLSGFRYHQPW